MHIFISYSLKAKGGLPGGMGRAFIPYAVLAADQFPDDLHRFVVDEYRSSGMTTINTGGTEYPILVDLATGRVSIRSDRQNVRSGSLDEPHREALTFFKPEQP